MKGHGLLFVGMLGLALAAPAWAQKSISQAAAGKVKATIEAIDSTNRLVTLKEEGGESETFEAGPEVKRFDELKVGDNVVFHYMESLAYDLRKPGEASKGGAAGASASRGTGKKPSASFFRAATATVTVEAVDPKVPSITVVGEDGEKITHLVKEENRKALEGVKPGDRIDISYTQTMSIDVESPKAK